MLPKIAAIQMCSSADVDANLKIAASLIESAASKGAQLIVLPEMFPIMGKNASDKIAVKENYGSGKIQDFLADQAKRHNVWIVGGTIPIACQDKNKIRAACIVYNNQGLAIARYDKIHLFDVTISEMESYRESDTTEPGSEFVVVDTPIGKLGLCVCYDIRFPNLFMQLSKLGAEVIVVPAAFTVKTGEAHWHLFTRCRAVENFCYVVGSAQEGMHANGKGTYGHSLIIDPWGTVLTEMLEPGVGVIYADIDLNKLHEIRELIPTKKYQ